jgi:cell shape-determining protein MreD
MNPLAFVILLWVGAGAEWGFRDALQLGSLSIAPSFLMIVLTFAALWATPTAALWCGLGVGVTLDLLNQLHTSHGVDAVVIGPAAIGCLVAVYLVVNMRAILLSHSLLTAPFVTLLAMIVAQVIAVTLLAMRATYDTIEFGPAGAELLQRLASAVFTATLSVAIHPVLNVVRPLCGFPEAGRASFGSH